MVMLNRVNFQRTGCVKGFSRVPSLRFSDTFVFKNIPAAELANIGKHPFWSAGNSIITRDGNDIYFIMDTSLASSPPGVMQNISTALSHLEGSWRVLSPESVQKIKKALIGYCLTQIKKQAIPPEALKLPMSLNSAFSQQQQVPHQIHYLSV
jgi:hypothetical protein